MKPRTFTQSMSWLHTWAGLLLGWALYAIFLTGSLAVFDKELGWWMQPELERPAGDAAAAAATAQRWLQARHADAGNWNIELPGERAPLLGVTAGDPRRDGSTLIDPASGETLEPRKTVGGNFFFRFHFTLHLPRNLGIWVVGLAGMAMLVALVSGIVIHKKIFKEFFTFRPAKGQRSWLDAHNASGVLLLPFHLMIAYTGLVIFFVIYMPAALDAFYGGDRDALLRDGAPPMQASEPARGPGQSAAPAPLLPLADFVRRGEAHYGPGMLAGLRVNHPGRADARVIVQPRLGSRIELTKGEALVFDGVSGQLLQTPVPTRTSLLSQRVLAGLHFAQFGGYPMRWLYFFCGLGGCAMIASGLVLYTVKLRKQAKAPRRWLELVERLNVASVAGLGLACVALLWANRLLPVELDRRGGWETVAFFGAWLLCFLHAAVRAPMPAWREQLAGAALLCLGLPLLDLATGGALDGQRLGVDLGALAIGLLLGWAAWRIPAAAAQPRPRPRCAGAIT